MLVSTGRKRAAVTRVTHRTLTRQQTKDWMRRKTPSLARETAPLCARRRYRDVIFHRAIAIPRESLFSDGATTLHDLFVIDNEARVKGEKHISDTATSLRGGVHDYLIIHVPLCARRGPFRLAPQRSGAGNL